MQVKLEVRSVDNLTSKKTGKPFTVVTAIEANPGATLAQMCRAFVPPASVKPGDVLTLAVSRVATDRDGVLLSGTIVNGK